MAGWVKVHRELMDKPIWKTSTAEQKVVLITLLMMADHKENEWEFKGEKFKTKPGQFITSLKSIRENAGEDISIQNIRTALTRFTKYEFLTSESTNKNRLVTIVNWDFYHQKDKDLTSKLTSSQQATNKQLTTNKNVRTKEVIKNNSQKAMPSDLDLENAHLLYELVLKNLPGTPKPNLINWANDFRILRERYKHADNFVKRAIQWSQDERFYMSGNIRSTTKFKKNYETICISAAQQVKKENSVKKPSNRLDDFEDYIENLKKEQRQGAIENEQK